MVLRGAENVEGAAQRSRARPGPLDVYPRDNIASFSARTRGW